MDEPDCPREQARGQAGRVLCTVGIRQGRLSLRGVGHLPHNDVAALSLGQHGLHLVHIPGTFLGFIILAVPWRIGSREDSRMPTPGPTSSLCLLTNSEVNVTFTTTQHQCILQLLAFRICSRRSRRRAL